MDATQRLRPALGRLVTAYKLRLAKAAERLGAQPETWGSDETISRELEERLLAGDGEYRLSPYPYPGLRSFDPQEGEFFFGRDRNVTELQNRLAAERIVVVLGGSGSGKSSLLRAGLLPYLNTTRRIRGREGSWYTAEFRPRTDPLGELVDALVDQCLLPLLELKQPALAEDMGLPAGASKEQARPHLRAKMRARFFDDERAKSRDAVLTALLEFADHQLDEYDRLACQGLRVPGPSLMLLLDQFEEVFRPEVPPDSRDALLNLIVDLHRRQGERSEKGGLFLAVTMRSEELHRCAEHRGLSEVINRSSYLLELLDPDNPVDREDLHRAIVQPARNVFDDWGLEYDRDCADAPFAPGMADWLLAGAKRSSNELEHRPDKLPLLQHALQATWHCAMRRWSDNDAGDHQLTIERKDLPGQECENAEAPDLGACLRARADKAASRAAIRFAAVGGTSVAAGEAALQAAFRALACRSDGTTWARRFAEPDDMKSFMAADRDSDLVKLDEGARWEALRQALHVFLLRGYLSGGSGRPYDISHEALIRNWPKFREWLQGPEEVAYALTRVLREVEPQEFRAGSDAAKIQLIPADVAGKVAMAGGRGQLPVKWAEDQIAPTLAHRAMQHRWGDEQRALRQAVELAASADEARQRAQAAEFARQHEEEQARIEAEQRKKSARLLRNGLIVVGVVALAGLSQAVIATQQRQAAVRSQATSDLKSDLSTLFAADAKKRDLERQAKVSLNYSFELKRDNRRALTEGNKNETKGQAKETEQKVKTRREEVDTLLAYRTATVSKINTANEKLWANRSDPERRNIVSNVQQSLAGLNSQSKLRVAMYAVAAIPQEYPGLNEALRNAIVDYRLRNYFRPPGASQIWGLAVDPHDIHRAAVGDDKGVVWLWDPSVKALRSFNAAAGVVNALAFTADGSLLAAAYRDRGAIVWDLGPEQHSPRCQLRATSGNSGAYGVAFHGITLAVASADNAVHLWDVSQPGCPAIQQKIFQRSDLVFGVAFSPDGKLLAAASGDGTVAVWTVDAPEKPLYEFPIGKPMFAVAFSPDGTSLAATGADGNGYLWTLQTKERIVLPSAGGMLGQVAFSPDGQKVVATASADGTAVVMDLRSGRELRLGGGGQSLFGVAFSPDSNYLLTASNLDAVVSWRINGDDDVAATGRSELLALGSQRLAEMSLTEDECRALRTMRIPIFEVVDNDKSRLCPFPFLAPTNEQQHN
jgi:WD domain, G-beta repeat